MLISVSNFEHNPFSKVLGPTLVIRKIENGNETALELVSGADFSCILMCGAGPGDLGRSRGSVWA